MDEGFQHHIFQHHVINLGAGVQSSTMALMAAHGEIEPMPDFAVFADTQAEPRSVYEWLDWLERRLPFPVHRVTAGSLRDKATEMRVTKDGRKYSTTALPVFTKSPDGSRGRIPHRTCTRDYKIRPLLKFIRQKLAIGRKQGDPSPVVVQWIGISLDEITRAKESREWWSVHRFPLLEKRMRRNQCLDWMRSNGYPEPPRSACTFCPFHSDEEWRRLKHEEPEGFAEAVSLEREIQDIKKASDTFHSEPYLHRSLTPLDEIDFRNAADHGQLSLWDDECEGMCGT